MDDYILGDNVRSMDNWDLHEIWDLKLIKEHLERLQKGEKIKKPIYDFSEHSKRGYEILFSKGTIILEGLYALHENFLGLLDFKIFVDASEGIRLGRRINRDIKSRGRTKERVLRKWKEYVQPTYLKYVEPQKFRADLIVINND